MPVDACRRRADNRDSWRWTILAIGMVILPIVACTTSTALVDPHQRMPVSVCPSPTPYPTITWEETYPTVINQTPTVVTEVYQTQPYEREYGRPMTPTPYARPATAFHIRETAAIPIGEHVLNITWSSVRTVTESDRTVVTAMMETVSSTDLTIVPVIQIGIGQVAQHGMSAAGWWPPVNVFTYDTDYDGRVVIPTGTTVWTWEFLLPPHSTPDTMVVRITSTDDLTLTWHLRTAGPPPSAGWDPYCAQSANGTVVDAWPNVTTQPVVIADRPDREQPVRETVVRAAFALIGFPYCFGGKGTNPCGPQSFNGRMYPGCPPGKRCYDCSGLSHAAWAAAGFDIGHGSVNQAHRVADRITARDLHRLRPGDLLFFWNEQRTSISHVAVYVGDVDRDGMGDMIHASWYDRPSHLVSNWYASYRNRFAWGGTPVSFSP